MASFYGGRGIRTRRFVTLLEAGEEAAAASSRARDIVVLPPDSGDKDVDTDIEDGDEIMESEEDPFEPAGELELEESCSGSDSECDSASEDDELPAKRPMSGQWRKRTTFTDELDGEELTPILAEYPELDGLSEFEIWQKICPPELIDEVIQQTKLFANRDKNMANFSISRTELARFFGILLLSGYHRVPKERDYWSNEPDLSVPIVSEAMSRNTFQTIKSVIHFADNQALPAGNKVAKVQPLYSSLNRCLVQFGMYHRLLSIDESMVPYYGRHSAKMFIRGKPIRFGFKLWCLCGSDGFPYHLDIYQGKEGGGRSSTPLGSRVINSMVSVIEAASDVRRHELYFDNFFTSHAILKALARKRVRATGTIRETRTGGAGKLLTTTAAMKKSDRGTFDYRCDGDVYVCKWNDNSIVHVASNHQTHEPIHDVRRRVRGAPNNQVKQPDLIRQYNTGMGGVDLMDRLLATYRPTIKGKKWYWPLFTNYLNITVVAAWRLFCLINDVDVCHLEFRRTITICLLKQETTPRSRVIGGGVPSLPRDVRYDGRGHDKESVSQGRCVVCKKNARYRCKKCQVRLHYDKGSICAHRYHTRESA